MKNILARGGIEFLAVFIGIVLSLWVDDRRDLNTVRETNYKTLKSLKNEINLRIDYIDKKIIQYQRDIGIGDYVISSWSNTNLDTIFYKTKEGRGIVLTLKAYRAINLPISIYNSLNSDGSIGKLDQDTIKVILDNLYEVFPAHIVDGVENERILYHSFNEYIIKNYPKIVDGNLNGLNRKEYVTFFNDDIVLGFTMEKTQIRKFILKLIINYKKQLIELDALL